MLISSLGCAHLPKRRPWTKQEKAAAVFFVVAHAADAYTTERFRDHGYTERNPILGKYPSDREIGLYFSITGLAALAFAHWYPKLRIPLLVPYGAVNTGNAIRNRKLY
jgi:hypothetical protein